MRSQTKDIYILFKRLPKYAILILKIKKIEHKKYITKMSTIQVHKKRKFKCEQTNLF